MLIERTSCNSTIRTRVDDRAAVDARGTVDAGGGVFGRVAVGTVAVARRRVADVQLRAGRLLLTGQEGVKLRAGREPVLLVAQVDVVDRQPAAVRVLSQGVGPQADAAALQGHQRVFQGGQQAAEAFHFRAGDHAAVARLEDGVLEAGFQELGLHLLLGLHVVGLLLPPHAEQRGLGHEDVARLDQVVHLPVEEGQTAACGCGSRRRRRRS